MSPAEGRNPAASSSTEHQNNLVGPLPARCRGGWREQRGDRGCPGLRIPLPQAVASLCPTLQHPLSSSILARQGTGSRASGAGCPRAGEQSVNRGSRTGERSRRNEEAEEWVPVVEMAWHGLWKMEA